MSRKRLLRDPWEDGETIRRRLCERLGVAEWMPDDMLLDLAEEQLDVWERNELEAGLPRACDE